LRSLVAFTCCVHLLRSLVAFTTVTFTTVTFTTVTFTTVTFTTVTFTIAVGTWVLENFVCVGQVFANLWEDRRPDDRKGVGLIRGADKGE
jgi:hypothetical protein